MKLRQFDNMGINHDQAPDPLQQRDGEFAAKFWQRMREENDQRYGKGKGDSIEKQREKDMRSGFKELSERRTQKLDGSFAFFARGDISKGITDIDKEYISASRVLANEEGYYLGRVHTNKKAETIEAPLTNVSMLKGLYRRSTEPQTAITTNVEPVFGVETSFFPNEIAEISILMLHAQEALADLLTKVPDYKYKSFYEQLITETGTILDGYKNGSQNGKSSKKFGDNLSVLFGFIKQTDRYLRQ